MDEIHNDINALVRNLSGVKDGHRENAIMTLLSGLHSNDLIPELPTHWFDEQGKPIPWENWTAAEIGIFDNTIDSERPKRFEERDPRGRIRTAQTRYGMALKFWCDEPSNFRSRKKPRHNFNIALWREEIAIEALTKLANEGRTKQANVEYVEKIIARYLDGETETSMTRFYGLLRPKVSKGATGYLKSVIAVVQADEAGQFKTFQLFDFESGDKLDGDVTDIDAKGKGLTGKCVGAIRVAKEAGSLGNWESE